MKQNAKQIADTLNAVAAKQSRNSNSDDSSRIEAINSALHKITVTRTRLIIHKDAFYGFLAMSMELVPRFDVPMGATDGRNIYFNPDYINAVTIEEIEGFIAEECQHIMLLHHTRRGTRDPKLWNVACDQVIFNVLSDEGYFIPEYVNFDKAYAGMSAEEVYTVLAHEKEKAEEGEKADNGETGDSGETGNSSAPSDSPDGDQSDESEETDSDDTDTDSDESEDDNGGDSDSDNTGGESGSNSGGDESDEAKNSDPETRNLDGANTSRGGVIDALNADGSEMSQAEKQREEKETCIKIAQAAQQAKAVGAGSGSASRFIKSMFEPSVPWQDVLKSYFEEIGVNVYDYTFATPDPGTRHLGLYLPDLETKSNAKIAVAVDVSGSISEEELFVFATELQSIIDEYDPERVYVLYFHSYVCKVEEYERGEQLNLEIPETGGTAFQPIFDTIEEMGISTDIKVCVVLTDLHGDSPIEPSGYPVIWCAYNKYGNAGVHPWGIRVDIRPNALSSTLVQR